MTNVTPLARLAERWVIVLSGGALYHPDGPVRADDPDDWDPELFRTEADARSTLDQLRGEAADMGIADWAGQVCRLGEVGAVTVPAPAELDKTRAIDLDAFNAAHPAPVGTYRYEYAIVGPGGPYRESDFEPEPGGEEFTVFPEREYADDRAADITQDWAPRLGHPYHPVVIAVRTVTTETGPWEYWKAR